MPHWVHHLPHGVSSLFQLSAAAALLYARQLSHGAAHTKPYDMAADIRAVGCGSLLRPCTRCLLSALQPCCMDTASAVAAATAEHVEAEALLNPGAACQRVNRGAAGHGQEEDYPIRLPPRAQDPFWHPAQDRQGPAGHSLV